MSDQSYASLLELHRLGILQEANRLFFHPLGLAMEWELPNPENPEDMTEPRVVGFQDARDDPEGWVFTDLSDELSHENADRVELLRWQFLEARRALFEGATIQPIGDKREP